MNCLSRETQGRMEKWKLLQYPARRGGGGERWNQGVLGSKATGSVKNGLIGKTLGKEPGLSAGLSGHGCKQAAWFKLGLTCSFWFGGFWGHCVAAVVTLPRWFGVFFSVTAHWGTGERGVLFLCSQGTAVPICYQALTYFVVIATIIHRLY